MFAWPKLDLTDYERKFVRPYKTRVNGRVLPGVLRRTYERVISNNNELAALPGLKPSAQLKLSRRARLFALTFSGSVSHTRLQITNASGTLYTVRDTRTNKDPYITALTGGSPYMEGSVIGGKLPPDPANTILTGEQVWPWLIEPNWILTPNETMIFNGNWDDLSGIADAVVSITAHVWEFPEMDNADKADREVI